MNPKRRHIKIKMTKIKERNLKETREKQVVIYEETPVRPLTDFSLETLQARREWHNIFQMMKGKKKKKKLQPQILYSVSVLHLGL